MLGLGEDLVLRSFGKLKQLPVSVLFFCLILNCLKSWTLLVEVYVLRLSVHYTLSREEA